MDEVITGLYAVTVHVQDIDRARTFYRDVLGFRELTFSAPASRVTFAFPGTSTILRVHVQGPGEG
ncbi:MAG: VOC family protein, partial [Thermoplasmata archaeon]|nr:VOC family protein [Thermoplasmata archaeon]